MENKEKEVKEEKHDDDIIRDSCLFSHNKIKKEVYTIPVVESGEYVVDDSCFVPMSEAIKQLQRIADPSSGQLAEVYDFPNGHDNGKILPITRQRNFNDLAEYSQEIRENAQNLNTEILKGQVEAAEKAAFEKELESVRAEASQTTSKK